MKKFSLLLLLFTCLQATAQESLYSDRRTISVTGTAEQEVTPDEIYVAVELKEYEVKGKGKVGLESIRRNFLSAAKALGLPDSVITIASYDGMNGSDWWEQKKRKEELYASITYQVKLRSGKEVHDLVGRLDDKATENFSVARVAYSKTTELRRQLKIDAIRAAREKARYLAEAIDARIGDPVTITEDTDNGSYWTPRAMMTNTVSVGPTNEDAESGNAFQRIKLKYSISAVFALK